jgi:hypothetical protein
LVLRKPFFLKNTPFSGVAYARDGFFFPFITHQGFSLRPVGALRPPLSFFEVKKGFFGGLGVFHSREKFRPVKHTRGGVGQLLASRQVFFSRRYKRGLWSRAFFSCKKLPRLLSGGSSGLLGFGGPVKAPQFEPSRASLAWSLRAARFKPGLATE